MTETEEVIPDPFIETEKKLIALQKDVDVLKKQLKEREQMMNKVIATNKQLLTEVNNKPSEPVVKKRSYQDAVEEEFFKHLGIKGKV